MASCLESILRSTAVTEDLKNDPNAAIVSKVTIIMAICWGLEKIWRGKPPVPSPIMPIPPRGEGPQEAAAFTIRPNTMTSTRDYYADGLN